MYLLATLTGPTLFSLFKPTQVRGSLKTTYLKPPVFHPFELEKIKLIQYQPSLIQPKQMEKLTSISLSPQVPFQTQIVKQIQGQIPTLKQTQIQIQKQAQALKQVQMQIPKLVWTPPPLTPVIPFIPPFPFPKFKLPEVRLPKKGGFWGGWFKRVHPIPTAEQMLKAFGLTSQARQVKQRSIRVRVPQRKPQRRSQPRRGRRRR